MSRDEETYYNTCDNLSRLLPALPASCSRAAKSRTFTGAVRAGKVVPASQDARKHFFRLSLAKYRSA